MKRHTKLRFMPLLAASLFSVSSCAGTSYVYSLDDYVNTLTYHDGFKIMQLTDIHLGVTSDLTAEFNYIKKLYEVANNPDLVVITGDLFMVSNINCVKKLFGFFDEQQIPWAVVWGNHDRQGFYRPSFVTEEAKKSSYGLLIDFDDGVYGDSNYIVNLVDNLGSLKWQIYLMDSNSYRDVGGLTYEYDKVHDDQLEWYEKSVNASKQGGVVVPSAVFMHIPLFEYVTAWEDPAVAKEGERREKCSIAYADSGFFNLAKTLGSTQGFFVGHDHVKDFAADYQDIILSYGVKSSDMIYHDDDMIGCQTITLHDSGDINLNDIERYFVGY